MADGGGGRGRDAKRMWEGRQREREQARGRAARATCGARGQPHVARATRARFDSLSGAKLFNGINAGEAAACRRRGRPSIVRFTARIRCW
eukprot:gene34606-6042_t